MTESNKSPVLRVVLPAPLFARVEEVARASGQTLSEFVREQVTRDMVARDCWPLRGAAVRTEAA